MMKSQLLLILLFPVFAVAQKDSLNWSFGASIGMDFTHRRAEANNEWIDLAYYDSLERGVLQWSANLMVQRRINQKWSVSSGLYWMNCAYRIDTVPETNVTALTSRFSYVGIPIEFAYAMRKEKVWRPYVKAGVFTGILIADREHYRQSDVNGRVDLASETDYVPFQFGALAAFGVQGFFYKDYSILCEIRYRQTLTAVAEGDLSRRFYNAGFHFGILKRF